MIQSFVMGKIKLALLDANIVYLAALTDFLSSREEFEVVAEGCDIDELIDSLEGENADILIADSDFLDGGRPPQSARALPGEPRHAAADHGLRPA